ncbi:hypothetical protein IT575_06365 [bacterium]|nr:hypothetical protein [bacterium]
MRHLLSLVTIFSLLALPSIAAADSSPASSATDPAALDPFGFREDQYSSWGLVDAAYPYQGRHGCYPVGNGICFAHLGVSEDFNTLRGITGPGYQTHTPGGETEWWAEGEWPDVTLSLWHMPMLQVDYMTLPDAEHASPIIANWNQQSIQVLRGAAMVRTIQRGGDWALYSMSYALPDYPYLIRDTYVFGPPAELDSLCIRFTPAYKPDLQPNGDWWIPGKRLVIHDCLCGGWQASQTDGSYFISCVPEEFNGRPCLHSRVALDFWRDGEASRTDPPVDDETAPQVAYSHWQSWSAQTRRFDTGNQKLDDLMLQVPVIIETQRDAASGGVAPMVSYHGYWVRDTTGPLLCYLENGRFDEVRRMLTYHRKASWKLGACRMSFPLDVDVSAVQEPVGTAEKRPVEMARISAGPTPTWDAVAVEHAEVPSLIVLQHYWYWKARRDAGLPDDGFVAEAWPYLKRNLFGMAFDPTYGVKFHGDETYAHGALYSTFDNDTTEDGAEPGSGKPLGYPNGYIPTDFFNRDNTMLHREAAKALAEMAGEMGQAYEEEAAHLLAGTMTSILAEFLGPARSPTTNQLFQGFFSNIRLAPFAFDYQTGADPDSVYALLWTSYDWAGMTGTTPESNFVTGHAPAGWLCALGRAGYGRYSEEELLSIMEMADPDASWCEVYGQPTRVSRLQLTAPAEPQLSKDIESYNASWLGDSYGSYRLPEFKGELPLFGPYTSEVAHRSPVTIYGRINRIRPWESGVNYFAISRYLKHRPDPDGRPDGASDISSGRQFDCPRSTELLVLTRDNHYKDVIASDYRLATVAPENITAWDIGLPITVDDLRHALLWEEGDVDYLVPFFYLDRDVKLSDRRTFKTAAFWESPEMLQLMADYKAAGGVVLQEADLRPAWELQAELRPNRSNSFGPEARFEPGLMLRIDGPPGTYTCDLKLASDYNTVQKLLASAGQLPPAAAFESSLRLEPGRELYLPLQRDNWEALLLAPGSVKLSYAPAPGSPAGASASQHSISPVQSIGAWLSGRELSMPELPAARFMSPQLDGVLRPWDGRQPSEWPPYPSLGLLPADAHILSGSFSPGCGDAGLSLNFGYDERYLYIAGTMLDDQLLPGGLWQSERINFVFDARLDSTKAVYPSGPVDKNLWQADDYWIALAPFCTDPSECEGGISTSGAALPAALAAARPLVQRIGGSAAPLASMKWSEDYKGFYGEVPGARCQVRLHADGRGYDFELALPLSSLPFLEPRPGLCCGFGVFISDFDSSGPQQPALSEAMWLTDWRAANGGVSWNFWDCALLYFAR